MNAADATQVFAVFLGALGGAMLYRAFTSRAKRLPRCQVVAYHKPDGADISVRACACNRCKNVVWVQRVEIQPPLYCAFCGQKFLGVDIVEDAEISKFIVTD